MCKTRPCVPAGTLSTVVSPCLMKSCARGGSSCHNSCGCEVFLQEHFSRFGGYQVSSWRIDCDFHLRMPVSQRTATSPGRWVVPVPKGRNSTRRRLPAGNVPVGTDSSSEIMKSDEVFLQEHCGKLSMSTANQAGLWINIFTSFPTSVSCLFENAHHSIVLLDLNWLLYSTYYYIDTLSKIRITLSDQDFLWIVLKYEKFVILFHFNHKIRHKHVHLS